MIRFLAVLGSLIATALAILGIMIVLGMQHAHAHDWFTRSGCCDGQDCKPWIPTPQNFIATGDGYRIILSKRELLEINPASKCDQVDEFIPLGSSKIKDSPVSSFGLCIKYDDADTECVRCLFIPGAI
jgi:hypothetical protein